MEKIIKRTKLPPIIFVLLGLALVFLAYLWAGGQDRLMPFYGFPEPAYGCSFEDTGLSSEPLPELSRGYRQSELLRCYPPQYFPLYALAILGVVVCGWTLVVIGKGAFQRERHAKDNFFANIGAFIISPLMILIGARVFKLELDLVGGSNPEPLDVFDGLALLLVLMGLLVALFGVVSVVVGAVKAVRHRLS